MTHEPAFIETECVECGSSMEIHQPKCSDCWGEFPDFHELEKERVIYESALRELVEEWREIQAEATLPISGLTGEGHVYKKCADDLETLIKGEADG